MNLTFIHYLESNEVSEDIIVAFQSHTSLKVSKHVGHMLEFVLNLNTNYVWIVLQCLVSLICWASSCVLSLERKILMRIAMWIWVT